LKRLEELSNLGACPEANLVAARFNLIQAKLQVAKATALAKLVASVNLDRLTVSLGM
jgi:hypothetical protein